MKLLTWRELGELNDKMMAEDLLSKRKAKAVIWHYVRVKLSDDRGWQFESVTTDSYFKLNSSSVSFGS